MMSQEDVLKIIELLRTEYPDVNGTTLNFSTPLELLVATILAAQCTDERVNEVTKDLFKKYKTAEDYAKADLEELEKDIKPTGFYRVKAKHLKKCCEMLAEEYDSEVPQNLGELTKLPGVARKTANLVLSNAFGINHGIAMDTHVRRLSKRLQLSEKKQIDKMERDLMELISKEKWFDFTYLIVAHGRNVCTARNPRCGGCVLKGLCPSAFTF
ncbi:MAG: endonuclease III [Candidatus Bathyarchaeota archaeon]|nr:endonuclease III [Candidatus Bathyarchaeota archaeon]